MRKLIVCNIISLDGFYFEPGGNVENVPMAVDSPFDLYNAELLRSADAMLFGHITYEGFRDSWPQVVDDERASDINREISRAYNNSQMIVISDTLTQDQTGAWPDTIILSRAAAHEKIAEIKQQEGKNIVISGSNVTWRDLLAAGLVDELHLMIAPMFLVSGRRLIADDPNVDLDLIDEPRAYEGVGNVVVRYKVTSKS